MGMCGPVDEALGDLTNNIAILHSRIDLSRLARGIERWGVDSIVVMCGDLLVPAEHGQRFFQRGAWQIPM